MTILELQQIGLKVTPQREALLRLLNESQTHPSAEDLYRELLRKFPRISFATVYNTLSKLAEAGKIQALDIDPRRKRFEPCKPPHHHFCCRVCGKFYDIAYDISFSRDTRVVKTAKVNGHEVDAVDIVLRGVCKDCKESDDEGTGQTEKGDVDERR